MSTPQWNTFEMALSREGTSFEQIKGSVSNEEQLVSLLERLGITSSLEVVAIKAEFQRRAGYLPSTHISRPLVAYPENEEESDVNVELFCKILVVGSIAAGKTSLLSRVKGEQYHGSYKVTIGVDFVVKDHKLDDNTVVSMRFWDIGGQESRTGMMRCFYKEAQGAFVVYDLTSKQSFEDVLFWKNDIVEKLGSIPVVLLANKCDLWPTPSQELDAFCQKNGFAKWFLTSAKTNYGIDEAIDFLIRHIAESGQLQSMIPPAGIPLVNSAKGRDKCCK